MRFKELNLSGVFLIEPELFCDTRGSFRRHYCREEYLNHGIKFEVMQGNISENPNAHTLRGFHYQRAPHEEGKIISCITGRVYDIVVDVRKESETYLEWEAVNLDCDKRNQLFIPPGCANAFLTTEPDTIVHYYMSEIYEPRAYGGFSYKDPYFKFCWPAPIAHISDKDDSLPNYIDSLELGTAL